MLPENSTVVIVGAGQAGFQTAASLREQGYAGRVVLIGAGFIGLEVAATAGAAGVQATVVEIAERPLKRALSAEMAAALQKAHETRGVRFRMQTSIAAIEGEDGRVVAVRTDASERL